ncbi:MAG: hypothetical protein HY782_12720 [Chloroflexi bacterium]|nr:hypothetical protein [Chloroflexota bacterium]
MLNNKSLVFLAGVLAITAFTLLISMSPATVVAQGPTPAATPVPPVAVLKVVGVPGNPNLPGAITTTFSYITDTVVGAAKTTIANATTGLRNVPINVPVFLEVVAQDPKNSGKPTWSLTKPPESKATITNTTAMGAKFTPDVVGAYYAQVTIRNEANVASVAQFAFFNAGTYIGVTAGNCKQCHPTMVAEWEKTGHASIMTDNFATRPTYNEYCIRCHTTGYSQPGANNGGFVDAQAKAGWKFPTYAELAKGGVWSAMPDSVKNMANIQCEQCHGPAEQHVKNGAKVMDASFANETCNVCHAGGGSHVRGLEEANSKHATGSSFEEINGPARQACVRCHSGQGFASFVKNPKNQAAWENEESSVGCATCHDPHDDKNYAQLRVQGKPVEVPFAAKDVGLSAICETCHNTRRDIAADVKTLAANGTPGYPHYSSAAELLTDLGGITYDQTVPNSPHGMLVGAAPVPNPATPGTFLWSKSDDKKGNVPGPCVVCHMAASVRDAKDPNMYKVGDHSFNAVSPDGTFDYGAACKSCHGEVKDFNLKAKADYDGNGKVEGVQDEVKGLLNVVWTQLEAKGWKKVNGNPYATVPTTADAKQKAAWYNFRTVYGVMWGAETGNGGEGKAAAIHNFKRSVALLQLSMKDLTGSLPAGMADGTK